MSQSEKPKIDLGVFSKVIDEFLDDDIASPGPDRADPCKPRSSNDGTKYRITGSRLDAAKIPTPPRGTKIEPDTKRGAGGKGAFDGRSTAAGRPAIPAMIAAARLQLDTEDDEGPPDARYTADVREAAEAARLVVDGLAPAELFESVHGLIANTFAPEIEQNPGFFRVKYFVQTPADLVKTMGQFSPAYNEPIGSTIWEPLRKVIIHESLRRLDSGAGGPRGIHFIHEPSFHFRSGLRRVVTGTTPAYSMDVSIDGKGSIEDRTTEVELWWGFVLYHPGTQEYARVHLGEARKLLASFGVAIGKLAEVIGLSIASDSALNTFFDHVDGGRMSKLEDHGMEVASLAEGQVLYEFNGRASFQERNLKVTLEDSTGMMCVRARDLNEASKRYNMPLHHFSLELRGGLNQVTFIRRFTL